MSMENYSPSHPTDDMDIDDSDEILPKDCLDIVMPKDQQSNNQIMNDSKPEVSSTEGNLKFGDDIESVAWFKELASVEVDSSSLGFKSQSKNSPTRVIKRSRSKSTEKRSISKTVSKRSRSRSGNKRSRSRNRRSRSRSGHRRRRSRSDTRRSTSRSHSRNRRSRSRNRSNHNDSRNRNSRSYGRDRDTKRPKSRSKTPIERAQVSIKDSRKRDTNKNSRSPEARPTHDRSDDNIFNKLSELRELPASSSPKQKWGYDSDDEVTNTSVKPVHNSFPDNRGGRGGNFGERSFRERQDFGDRRGRGFQRGTPYGQPRPNYRNDNNDDSRTQQWGQPRQDYGFNRTTVPIVENTNTKDQLPILAAKNAWESDDESCNWGKKEATNTTIKLDVPCEISSNQKIENDVKKDKFAVDSDEEFGNWGKELKGDSIALQESISKVDSTIKVTEEVRGFGVDTKARVMSVHDAPDLGFASRKNVEINKSPPTDKFAENSDEEFGAWGKETSSIGAKTNESKNTSIRGNETKGGGAWGNEAKGANAWGNETKSGGAWGNEAKGANAWGNEAKGGNAWGNETKGGNAWGNETKGGGAWNNEPVYGGADKVIKKASDSDDECGAWGNEQRSTKAITNNDSFQEPFRDEDPFASEQRGNFQGRGGFNNNQYGPRRGRGGGGPRNFENNRFQRPPIHDRFYNNAPNYQNDTNFPGSGGNPNVGGGGYNSGGYNNPPQPMQPNYNYKPPQMPQWATQSQNMSYPPRPPGPMPFPLDTSVCPPMNMLHQPSSQMMQTLPFIPPPPPSMPMDNRGPSMAQGGVMNLMGGHNLNIGQSSMNMGQPGTMNQTPMNMSGQQVNMMGQSMGQTQPINPQIDANLLETLMTRVGLPSDSLRLDKKQDSSNAINDTINTMLKTAANTVISRLVESSSQKVAPIISDNMSMSPPSPPANSPPPAIIRYNNFPSMNAPKSSAAPFIPPPLPNYSDVLKPSTNKIPIPAIAKTSSADLADEEKRNRSDFDSKLEWQERVALEVKVFLKPAYMSRSIDKNDYKEIMKRCVTKITRSGVTEINSEKIEKFVLSYVDKYNKNRKVKQHSTVSSSEHDLRCD